jgi:hypothetical protein
MTGTRISLVSLMLVATLGASTHAQPEELVGESPEAVRSNNQARAYYKAGAYGEAGAEFERSHTLGGGNNTLFNAGLSYEKADMKEEAIRLYARFLELETQGSKVLEARARMTVLQKKASRGYSVPQEQGPEQGPVIRPPSLSFVGRGQVNRRYNPATESSSSGFGLDLHLRVGLDNESAKTQVFVSVGLGIGYATVELQDMTRRAEASHRFYSPELLGGVSLPLGTNFRLELTAGVAPGRYSITSPNSEGFGDATAAGFVVEHLRATVGLSYRMAYLGAGIRRIGSSLWFQPISLGLTY